MRDSSWLTFAACKGMDTTLFFVERGKTIPQIVKDTCASCPVNPECLEDSLGQAAFGIRAGLSLRERRVIRRQRAMNDG